MRVRRPPPGDDCFLLVSADADPRRLAEPSAYEIATHMLHEKKWPLKARTPHRSQFCRGTKLVIYAAGKRENGGCIVAFAEAAGPPKPAFAHGIKLGAQERFVKHLAADFVLPLRSYELFSVPLPLRDLRQEMSFVSNPDGPKWGNRLQTGVVALSARDHRIISKARKSKMRVPSGPRRASTAEHP